MVSVAVSFVVLKSNEEIKVIWRLDPAFIQVKNWRYNFHFICLY
jgi:hypothetical protein